MSFVYYVYLTYQGNAVKQFTYSGIEDFHWHDLRTHLGIRHVKNGTSLYELQRLGGWSSYGTVQRYAHLNSQQLQEAAERLACTNLVHNTFK